METKEKGKGSGSHNTHARLSPSGSKQWVNCTASIGKVEQLIAEGKIGFEEHKDANSAANEGTQMHDLAEEWLRYILLDGDQPDEIVPEQLQVYLDECRRSLGDNSFFDIERPLPLFYSPEETGTGDFVTYDPDEDLIRIIDLKWGMMPVDPEGNTQLAIYGKSWADELQGMDEFDNISGSTTIRMTIVQPRLEVQVKHWECSLAELAFFCMGIGDAAEAINAGENLVFAPSEDTCFWCRARAHCGARNGPIMEDIKIMSREETPNDLTDEDRFLLWSNADRIRATLKDIENDFYDNAVNRDILPEGTKLVKGRKGNKAWRDESVAIETLEELGVEDYLTTKIVTPTQALAKLPKAKKSQIDELWFQPEGKLKLVLDGDPAPMYSSEETSAEDFV